MFLVIYVLTLSLCIAPEGKTACEGWDRKIWFHHANDCLAARGDYLLLYENYPRAILYEEATKCEAAVVHLKDYPAFDDAQRAKHVGDEELRIARDFRAYRDNPKAFPEDTLQRLLDRKQKLQLR